MVRYCLSDIAKGLFNGMIGNYLLYFFQPTVKSGLPNLLPQTCMSDIIQKDSIENGVNREVGALNIFKPHSCRKLWQGVGDMV